MPSFRDSVVLITGAASGIGTALAGAAAERGAEVIVTDLDGDGAGRVAAGLRGRGLSSESRPLDVTDRSAFK
ncbi:MAG: SDR family NAD(P)-dependent oxidoreductase, partial [Acidobacteriota bacterium]